MSKPKTQKRKQKKCFQEMMLTCALPSFQFMCSSVVFKAHRIFDAGQNLENKAFHL